MSNLWVTLNYCTEPDILKVILYVQIILKYVFYIVPIGLIVMLGIDFGKNVIAKNEEEMKKNASLAIKRLVYCVAMFFVPTIVSLVMSIVNDSISDLSVDYEGCIENTKYIEYYEQMAAAQDEIEEQELQQKLDEQRKKAQEEEVVIIYSGSGGSSGTGNNGGKLTLDWTDVTKISNVSAADLKRTLETSKEFYGKEANFAPYAATYVSLERQNGVNVFLLLGIHALESGWLSSYVTKTCNNIAGVKYVGQAGTYKCTISTEKDYYAGWPSLKAFLTYYVPWIKREYLTETGDYYEGKTPEAINIHYCGSSTWPSSVKSIGTGLYNQVKKTTNS